MKYKKNDKVSIEWNDQFVPAEIIKGEKFFWWNRYLCSTLVNIRGEDGEILYKKRLAVWRFERNIYQ